MKNFLRFLSYHTFRIRHFNNKCVKSFSKNIKNKKILELGSGKKFKGRYFYSAKEFFDKSNNFIQTDINPQYGHKIVDATNMDYKNEFDIVLCLNVLEHIFDFKKVIKNIHKALKPNGTALFFVPGYYPLHDEPYDYWRFTEHSLRKLLKNFRDIKIKHYGVRQYPLGYFIETKK